jgi:hypothetical protein
MTTLTWKFEDKFKNAIKMNVDCYSTQMKMKVEVRDTDWFLLKSKDLVVIKRLLGEVIRELRCRYHARPTLYVEKKESSKDYELSTVSPSKFAILRFDDMIHWNNVFFFNLSETIIFRRQISDMLTNIVLARKAMHKK